MRPGKGDCIGYSESLMGLRASERKVCVMLVQAYEARFNPFAEFQQSEEVSRTKSLPVHDRAILTGSRCTSSNVT